jgi:hypothetical protein
MATARRGVHSAAITASAISSHGTSRGSMDEFRDRTF